jgi:hypothetical protein
MTTYANQITIDGSSYNVPVTMMKRKAEFLYKYAERTIDGTLHSELIGVYFNYQLQFGMATMSDYAELWEKLTEPVEFHTIVIPDEDGNHTFEAYFSNVADEFKKVDGSTRWLKDLTVNFIAQEPARS